MNHSSQKLGGLATPEPTPEVDSGRVAADEQRLAAASSELLRHASPDVTGNQSTLSATEESTTQDDESTAEINRVMQCLDSQYAEILAIPPSSAQKNVLTAWRHLGCMVHPRFNSHANASIAFKKLRNAARNLGLDDLDIDEVWYWDGEEKLDAPELDEDTPMSEDAIPMPPARVTKIYETASPLLGKLVKDPHHPVTLGKIAALNTMITEVNAIEKVPLDQWTIPLSFFGPHYGEILRLYSILNDDRANQSVRDDILKEKSLIDNFIERQHLPNAWSVMTPDDYLVEFDAQAIMKNMETQTKEATELSDAAIFAHKTAETHLATIQQANQKAEGLGEDTKAKIQEAEQAITAEVANALAAAATTKAASEKAGQAKTMHDVTLALDAAKSAYTTAVDAEKAARVALNDASEVINLVESAASSLESPIEYPWPTAKAADGSLILGVRQLGRFGTQVCVETREETGHMVRRLESASDVGLLDVSRYLKITGFKNLAEGQSQWSYKDRSDFDELLWITKSQIKCKNTAANKKDPSAYCCTRFRSKGIQILSKSSLVKVLGSASALAEIEKVCNRDNIAPPWKAGWISQYHDPSKVEKDAARRRALKDSQSKITVKCEPSTGRPDLSVVAEKESEAMAMMQTRVEGLETQLRDVTMKMDKKMESLMDMFKEFMKASTVTS
ncbi:hypothetical protein FMUND_15486 [Fusarium mundagurra]|uniref:J domain-containing protein n=1 Tax=Fusarium mundagurra TaxID=1567541 RepID=A0A8H5XNP1_9HYPO|nr:hypothetical protein FMUND_15486 [Fusarium mundagurra]